MSEKYRIEEVFKPSGRSDFYIRRLYKGNWYTISKFGEPIIPSDNGLRPLPDPVIMDSKHKAMIYLDWLKEEKTKTVYETEF